MKSRTVFEVITHHTRMSIPAQSRRNKFVFTKSRRKIRAITQSRNPMGGGLLLISLMKSKVLAKNQETKTMFIDRARKSRNSKRTFLRHNATDLVQSRRNFRDTTFISKQRGLRYIALLASSYGVIHRIKILTLCFIGATTRWKTLRQPHFSEKC